MLLVISDSGESFEVSGGRKRTPTGRSNPSRLSSPVSRNLFGTADQSQNQTDLSALNERLMADACERWNFDFPTGRPFQGGRYEWMSSGSQRPMMSARQSSSSEPFVDVGSEKSPGDNYHSTRTLSDDVRSVASSRDRSSRDASSSSSSSLRSCVRVDGLETSKSYCCESGIPKRVSKAMSSRRPRRTHRTKEEETPSPLITDYFWKRKCASSTECSRHSK